MFTLVSKTYSTLSKYLTLNKINKQFNCAISFISNLEDFKIKNEPILDYFSQSSERKRLEECLKKYENVCFEIPLVIDGIEVKSNLIRYQKCPFNHSQNVAEYFWATPEILNNAISVSMKKREEWEKVPFKNKIDIFLNAANLASTKYRMDLIAATMIGQAKTVFQAEIDSVAEFVDFLRFNCYFVKELCKYEPISENPKVVKNFFRYRGLEGFVAAISPFNFTAIGGNLITAPALMGNVVLWKPSDNSILSSYIIFKILQEAGVPPGVINFLPCDGSTFGKTITLTPHLAGINFTGSIPVFKHLWKEIAKNLDIYKSYPRLSGECGGKNYHLVHNSADIETVVFQTIRSAFEFGGQKCSACSRLFVPQSLWPKIREKLIKVVNEIKVGSPLEYDSFFSAVIDATAFNKIKSYIDHAKNSPSLAIIAGGQTDNSKGYFIRPTIIECKDLEDKIMKEEIFGPVLSVFVYEDAKLEDIIELIRQTKNYALTGAIFGKDEQFLNKTMELLKMTAGNFYINDKSTGAIVGQQPFGGSRLSGTNDKPGGPHYLLRWTSPQAIKQSFVPLNQWDYQYMRQ